MLAESDVANRFAAGLLQSLELSQGLAFMPRKCDCECTRFADLEADGRLQEAVEAGRCGRWLDADGVKWRADTAIFREGRTAVAPAAIGGGQSTCGGRRVGNWHLSEAVPERSRRDE
jgi:hypothetical protein